MNLDLKSINFWRKLSPILGQIWYETNQCAITKQSYTHTYFSPSSLCMKNSDAASYIVTIALEPFLDDVFNEF